ncbi:transposable element Tcb1 transposase [Trichonephila clavipes]|nr:transposable element Tcb1 transposase [Trichonephila clavipes]
MQITGNHRIARIVRHNDESVREEYVRNGGKEVKLFTSALKAFQCNNCIVMAQRKYLEDFLRGRIIGRLGNVDVPSWKYQRNLESPRVPSPGFDNDSKMMSTTSDLSRQLSSATGTTVSRQTVYRRLGHIGLYARRSVTCVPLTATDCRLRLTWSREQAFWTPHQWSCMMFSDESRFSLQSDFLRTLSVTMPVHIYRDVILEQVIWFRDAMGAEFLFMDDNARLYRANIVDECLQSEDITRMDWSAYSPDLNLIEHVWNMLGRRIAARQPLPPVYRNFGGHCLMSGVIFPKIRLIILYSACLVISKSGHQSSRFVSRFLRLTATAGSDVVQSGRPIFDDFFQHLRPYIGNNTANVVFQMVKRLWLIRIDQ